MSARRPQASRTVPSSPQSLTWQENAGAAPCFKRQPATKAQALMEAPPGHNPEESTEDDDGSDGGPATAALAALSERHREAFALSRLAGLPYAEVAKRLGVSKTTAFRLANEAHELLLKALESP